MRIVFTLLLLISGFSAASQMSQLQGKYSLQLIDTENHKIEYTLDLNQDGTFHFHAYTNNKARIPNEDNKYGKGRWIAESKKKFSTEYVEVSFITDVENELDETFTLDFNNTKARFITKSPRDKSETAVDPMLSFFSI